MHSYIHTLIHLTKASKQALKKDPLDVEALLNLGEDQYVMRLMFHELYHIST
jgi:hypothetical protein